MIKITLKAPNPNILIIFGLGAGHDIKQKEVMIPIFKRKKKILPPDGNLK